MKWRQVFLLLEWVRGLRAWSSEREVDEDFEYSQSLSVMGRKADQGEIKGVRATWRFKSHWFVGTLGYLACDVSLATLGFLDTGVRQMCEEKRPVAGESAVYVGGSDGWEKLHTYLSQLKTPSVCSEKHHCSLMPAIFPQAVVGHKIVYAICFLKNILNLT